MTDSADLQRGAMSDLRWPRRPRRSLTCMRSAGSRRAFRASRWKRNSPRRQDAPRPPAQTDQQAFYNVLSKPENRYLARQLCWVLTIQGLETYIAAAARSPGLSIGWWRPSVRQPSPLDIDVVIGTRGPIAPPELCNGLMVPIVVFDQIYSFDRDALIKAIPRPEKMTRQAVRGGGRGGVR